MNSELSIPYRSVLLEELAKRKTKNPSYSLRAFARDLGISSTSLSDVLSSKRHLSKKNAKLICDALALSPSQTIRMLNEIKGHSSFSDEELDSLRLQEDTFAAISEWYYIAILSLARIPENQANETWIAERLGISPLEVRIALERLLRLRFLKIVNGRLKRTVHSVTTTHNVPSSAIRKFHKQNLNKAIESLERDPVPLRFLTSITMAVDPNRLEEAKTQILRFRNRISKLLETGKPKEVYHLAIQLIPLTRQRGNA